MNVPSVSTYALVKEEIPRDVRRPSNAFENAPFSVFHGQWNECTRCCLARNLFERGRE